LSSYNNVIKEYPLLPPLSYPDQKRQLEKLCAERLNDVGDVKICIIIANKTVLKKNDSTMMNEIFKQNKLHTLQSKKKNNNKQTTTKKTSKMHVM
jgi:hypothetical protein